MWSPKLPNTLGNLFIPIESHKMPARKAGH